VAKEVIVPYRSNRPLRGLYNRQMGRLGAVVNLTSITSGSTGSAAVTGASEGASVGATFGPIGAGVGAIVGAVGATLANVFSAPPNTPAHLPWATSLVNSLSQITTTAGVGRQLPLNQDGPSVFGIAQMLEGLMATGAWLAWDTSLISSYDVCAHWSMAFTSCIQTLVQSICTMGPGPQTISLNASQGDTALTAVPFTFNNPGPNASSDQISANLVMGMNGMVYAIISHTGATQAQAANGAVNPGAQKVFGLMVDYYLAQYAPQPVAAPTIAAVPTPAPTPVVTQSATTVPQGSIASTSTASSASSTDPTDALIQQLIAQGASQSAAMTAALQDLASRGVDTTDPEVQAAVQQSAASAGGLLSGISPTTLLLVGGVIVAIVLMSRKS
jgi:hypothetical protein